jgi:hypothetical protein
MDLGNADNAGAIICHAPRPSGSLRSFKIVPDDFVSPWAPLSFRISHSCFGLSLGSEVHPAANTIYLQW